MAKNKRASSRQNLKGSDELCFTIKTWSRTVSSSSFFKPEFCYVLAFFNIKTWRMIASVAFIAFFFTLAQKWHFKRLARQSQLWVKPTLTLTERLTRLPLIPFFRITHQDTKKIDSRIASYWLNNSKLMLVILHPNLTLFKEYYQKVNQMKQH